MSIIKKVIPFFLLISLLFALFLWQHNSTTLVIKMQEKNTKTLFPQVYYTKISQPYTQEKSAIAFNIQGENYLFKLPSKSNIDSLRLDPDTKAKRNIVIKQIKVIENRWFSKKIFIQPIDQFKPLHDIINFKSEPKKVELITSGADSYMQTPFQPKLIQKVHLLHLPLLLAAVITSMIILFLYNIYKKDPDSESLKSKLILYALFTAFMIFKGYYYKTHVSLWHPSDELAHVSYVYYVNSHHNFFPEYENMTMLNNKKAGNYLSHPPLYYEIENLVYDPSASLNENTQNFRTMSLVLYTLATLLLFYIGFNSSLSILGHFIYLSVIASIPMYAYAGGSVSNDSLSFIGSSLFLIGLYQLLQKRHDLSTWLLIALGGFIAYFAKLTAALLIFFALLYYIVYKLFKKEELGLTKKSIILLGVALVPIVLYQAYIMFHYHTLVPTFNATHPQQYLHSPFFVPEQYRLHLSPWEWLQRMGHYIQGGWFNIHSHHSFGQSSIYGDIGLLLLHIMALSALFLPCKEEQKEFCLLGKITLVALLSVLVIQYLFSYKAHLKSGYLGGLQPRYLLPFLVGFAIMASVFAERYKRFFALGIVFIIISIHAIYSDFFYFLLYYR